MSVTGTGWVFVFIGIYGLLFNKKFLYKCLVFFIPFSATAVINVGADGNGSAVQPFTFLGTLWLISLLIKKRGNSLRLIKLNKNDFNVILMLLVFSFVTLISLIMPVLINGKEVGNVTGSLNSSAPITFSFRNITQYIYLLFGVVMAIGFYFHNRTESNYAATLKIYSYSIMFVVFWGCVELFCFYKNLAFPSFIFNNSISGAAHGFGNFLDSEEVTKRISSVTVEASCLVQTVEVLLPFLITGFIKKKYIFNRTLDLLYIIVLYIFIIRTTSTLGIIGLGFISIWSLLFYLKTLDLKRKIIASVAFTFMLPIVLLVFYGLFHDIIEAAIFNKSDGYSSLERSGAVIDAWHTFLNHPLLGAGWGSVSSFDLFVSILSNTGIIGCLSLIAFLIFSIRNQLKADNIVYIKSNYKSSIILSFCTMIFSAIFSGFSFFFGFFWLTTGLMLVTGTNFYQKA